MQSQFYTLLTLYIWHLIDLLCTALFSYRIHVLLDEARTVAFVWSQELLKVLEVIVISSTSPAVLLLMRLQDIIA